MNEVESSPLFIATKEKIQRAEKFLKTLRELEAQSQLTDDLLVAELKQLHADNEKLQADAARVIQNRRSQQGQPTKH